MSAERKEAARQEVLHYLAVRSAVKQSAELIHRGLKRQGNDFTQQEVSEALVELGKIKYAPGKDQPAEPLVEAAPGGLGAVLYFGITGAGLLYDERN